MNASFNHYLIPHEVLKGDLSPTVKDVEQNMTESRKKCSHFFFLIIWNSYFVCFFEEKISFNNRQFVFKNGCTTAYVRCILKEILYEYKKNENKA